MVLGNLGYHLIPIFIGKGLLMKEDKQVKTTRDKKTKSFKHKLIGCTVCIILVFIALFCFGFYYNKHPRIEGRAFIPEENTPQPLGELGSNKINLNNSKILY